MTASHASGFRPPAAIAASICGITLIMQPKLTVSPIALMSAMRLEIMPVAWTSLAISGACAIAKSKAV